ncbi:MAG: PilZ domain-containing protein [Myxococcota bacterium]|nr:PilZ domain-containing protein [Myxococcota bacterium]
MSNKDKEEIERYERLEAEESSTASRSDRLALQAKVSVRSDTNFYMGFSENISEGGIFVSTIAPPNIGDEVELDITGEDGQPIAVKGIVRWHRVLPDESLSGCGIQFIDLTENARVAIEGVIATLRRDPLFVDIE